MKIQILSDLHLEFADYDIECSESDIIIIAGDVHIGNKGVLWIQRKIQNKPVLYVLGNHEYYHNAFPELLVDIKLMTKGTNIHVLENDVFNYKGLNFLGCTLWTDFNLFGNKTMSQLECQFKLNDFKMIKNSQSKNKILPTEIEEIFKNSLSWLVKKLEDLKGKKNIIITHHAPSIKSVPERFKTNLLSTGFASNLENLISIYKPLYWIHGHTHDSFDYRLYDCRVICNPKGYPHEKNFNFNPNFTIEI